MIVVPFNLLSYVAGCPVVTPPERVAGNVAFVGVNVVSMASESPDVLEAQTVVVIDGRITTIADADQVTFSDDTAVVPAEGMFLVPGFIDMHTHVFDERDGVLFVAHGITQVVNMSGTPELLAIRDTFASGAAVGPEMWSTGPLTESDPPSYPWSVVVNTAGQATAEIERQAAAGYDMVKVYSMLRQPAYDAVLDAAAQHGLPVVGHVPIAVGVDYAARAGQRTAEHLLEYNLGGDTTAQVATTIETGMGNTPTFVPMDRLRRIDVLQRDGIEGLDYVNPVLRGVWDGMFPTPIDVKWDEMQALVRDLAAAGGKLYVGTDANVAYVVPGWGYHDELQFLVDAGLDPYAVLRMATIRAAESLGIADRSGTVELDRRADLVLLRRDPRADITATQDRAGVMVDGVWYPEDELDTMLAAVRRSYGAGEQRRTARTARELPVQHGHP